jgi:hypothetical protein
MKECSVPTLAPTQPPVFFLVDWLEAADSLLFWLLLLLQDIDSPPKTADGRMAVFELLAAF